MGYISNIIGFKDFIFAAFGNKLYQWNVTTKDLIRIYDHKKLYMPFNVFRDDEREISALAIQDVYIYTGGNGYITKWNMLGENIWVDYYSSRVIDIFPDNDNYMLYSILEDNTIVEKNLITLKKKKHAVQNTKLVRFISKSIKRDNTIFILTTDGLLYFKPGNTTFEMFDIDNIQIANFTQDSRYILLTSCHLNMNLNMEDDRDDDDIADYICSIYINHADTRELRNFIYTGPTDIIGLEELSGYVYILTRTQLTRVKFKNPWEETRTGVNENEAEQLHMDLESLTLEEQRFLDRNIGETHSDYDSAYDDEEYEEYDEEEYDNTEEDSENYTNLVTESESIIPRLGLKSCTNDNLITLEPYTKDDDPIVIYLPDSKMKYNKSVCSTKEELVQYLESMKDTGIPDNIMTIYTSPRDNNVSGYGGKPTGKIIVKLPVMNIYVTYGSLKRILHNKEKQWYAMPLFGGKRRRVGNLMGIFGSSMNHGQVPGFVIYKLYNKRQIKNKMEVKETGTDYPSFIVDNTKILFDILGEGNVNAMFVQGLVNDLIN
jgi:hypothetical protein